MKKKTILLWWLFVTALEPEKFKISCLDRFLATTICTDVAGLAQLYRAHTRFNVVTFLLSITVLLLFFFFNEFFNVSSALKEYCFFDAKWNSHRRLCARTGFWPLLLHAYVLFLEGLHNFLAHLYLMRAVTFLLNTTVLFLFWFHAKWIL